MRYMDQNNVEDFSYEDAWELAKILAKVTKPKTKKDFAIEKTIV